MQYINEKSHYATLIASLNKEYNKTKIGKSLTPNDIYLLDILYNLINGCCLELNDRESRKLLDIYNNILFNSKVVCNNSYQEKYQISKKNKFIQAEKTDCNDIPIQPKVSKIYYWQEQNYLTTIDDILLQIPNVDYFTNKLFDTYSNFKNIGKTITYEYLGRICFYITESDNKEFKFFDELGNNVTDIFDIIYISNTNTTLIVSKDFYSISNMFFKIKTQ